MCHALEVHDDVKPTPVVLGRAKLSNEARIAAELKAFAPLSDRKIANHTNIPLPSVRRTRLHMVAVGAVVRAGQTSEGIAEWRLRKQTEKPNGYTGRQKLS